MSELIIALSTMYIIICFSYLVGTGSYAGHHYFNILDNYVEWDRLNLFGVTFFTLLLNLLFAPVSIIYWTVKVLVFIFTVGRR